MSYNQIENNRRKIQEMLTRHGQTHSYSQTEWLPWYADGFYIKSYYDVKLPNGKILEHQWPNAGQIAGYTEGVLVKLSDTHMMQNMKKASVSEEDKTVISNVLNKEGIGNLINFNQQSFDQLSKQMGIVQDENVELKNTLRQVIADLERRAIANDDIDSDGTVCLDLSNGLLLKIETLLLKDRDGTTQKDGIGIGRINLQKRKGS